MFECLRHVMLCSPKLEHSGVDRCSQSYLFIYLLLSVVDLQYHVSFRDTAQ